MKKLNKKGFVLLETLLVSTFIITILIYLYIQFVNLKNSYDKSLKYDSVSNIYSLKQVDQFINKTDGYADLKEAIKKSNNNYIELYNNTCELEYFSKNNSYCNKLMTNLNVKTVLMINNRLEDIKTRFKTNNPYSNGLYNYLKSIDKTLASKSYLLIAEFKDNTYGLLKLDDINVVVTFDANGGSVSTKTMNVTPGQKYGNLPTPTREGYTFKGWNGKNMMNIDSIGVYRGTKENNTIKLDASDVDGNKVNYLQLQLHKNGSYVRSTGNITSSRGTFNFDYDNSFDKLVFKLNSSKADPSFSCNLVNLNINKKYSFSFDIKSLDYNIVRADIVNIQLEEGETATEYEPYYITKDTKVVQDDNHTLKAIWEKNS